MNRIFDNYGVFISGFVAGILAIIMLALFSKASDGSRNRAAALQWAKSVPAYTLIDTHMFNNYEYKTYRQNKTGKLFLLTPGGEWISVED